MSSKPARATERVPRQQVLHSEDLSLGKKKKSQKDKALTQKKQKEKEK